MGNRTYTLSRIGVPWFSLSSRPDVGGSLAGSKLHLLPGGQVLDGGEALPDLVLSQDDGVGDADACPA